MGELIGREAAAEHHQALTIRGRFECPVVHDPDQLSADEYVYIEFQTRKSSYKTKHPIGPVGPLERDLMVLHEGAEQRRVTLLLANEQFHDPHERGDTAWLREALSSSQERTALGLFPELKRRNRARN